MARKRINRFPSVKALSIAIWLSGTSEYGMMVPNCGQLLSYQIDKLWKVDTETLALLWTLTRIGHDLGFGDKEMIKKIKGHDIYTDNALIRWSEYYGISIEKTNKNRVELLENLEDDGFVPEDIDCFLKEVMRRKYKDSENPHIIETEE